MPWVGTNALTEVWAKVKANFGHSLNGNTASTTYDIKLVDGNGTTLSTQTIPAATTTNAGVMIASDKSKLDGVAEGANKYTHPAGSAASKSAGFYKISTDTTSHVKAVTKVALSDLTGLGAAPIASPIFTGTPAAPTAAAGTNTTQIATTAFVTTAVSNAVASNITFQGTVDSQADIISDSRAAQLPLGAYWVVKTAGTYFDNVCEVGDMIISIKAISPNGTVDSTFFSVVQNNLIEMTTAEVDAICI